MAWCIGWLPVAAFWIYSKQIRIHDRFFPLLSAYSGIEGKADWLDRVAILRPDLFLSLLVIPAAITVSLMLWPRSKLVRAWWITWSLLVATLLFANLHSWGTVGQFLTGTALVNAMAFGLEQPEMIQSYIGMRGLIKLGVILAAVVVCSFGLAHLWRVRWLRVTMSAGTLAVVGSSASLAVASLASPIVMLPVTRDFVHQSVEALVHVTDDTRAVVRNGVGLDEQFDRLTERKPSQRSAYFGRAADQDLIVFVLETGSTQFMDLERQLNDFPTLQALRSESIMALNHHSVFPATAEAVFSMFTSVYPARSLYTTCVVDRVVGAKGSKPFAGFVSALAQSGYSTSAYLPFTSVVPLDKALMGGLGLGKLYYAQQHPAIQGEGRDLQALGEMLRDIETHASANKRYAALYFPQVGHAPWPDRPQSRSIKAHGKLVAQRQDEWLGRVVSTLKRLNRLDKTTIVVTGDHGIRTTSEDPSFKSGLIDQYSFHVPLFIYSPGVFKGSTVTDPTSHVDISPTLLDMFGLATPSSHQGTNIWDSWLTGRRQFFLASWYFGADGFREGGTFHMRSDVLGLAFTNTALTFDPKMVVRSRDESERIKSRIESLYSIQQQWVSRHLCQ